MFSTWNFVISFSSPVDVSPCIVVAGCVDARLAWYSATVSNNEALLSSSSSSSPSFSPFSSSFLLCNEFDDVVFKSVNELGVVPLDPPNNGLLRKEK